MRKNIPLLINSAMFVILLSGFLFITFGIDVIQWYFEVQNVLADIPARMRTYTSGHLYIFERLMLFGLGLSMVSIVLGYSIGRYAQKFHHETS